MPKKKKEKNPGELQQVEKRNKPLKMQEQKQASFISKTEKSESPLQKIRTQQLEHFTEQDIELDEKNEQEASLEELGGPTEKNIDFYADSFLEKEETSFNEDFSTPQSRQLSRLDPLLAYIHEIRRYPLLTRDEEQKLAKSYAENKDPTLARKLVTSNLRLVVKISYEYRNAYRHVLDLIQEGNIGLMQAVQKYDPYKGVRLSSYAAWWIRAYILKFILNNWRLVKIGTTQTQRKLFYNLSKERESLEAAGFVPTAKLLAEKLSVSEKDVTDMQLRLGSGEVSLDAPLDRDSGEKRNQLDLIEGDSETRPDVSIEAEEFRVLLKEKLQSFDKTLKGREQTLFRERLLSEEALTLQEVGDKYGISRERARQLEARLMEKLRAYLKRELGDAVQIAMGLEGSV